MDAVGLQIKEPQRVSVNMIARFARNGRDSLLSGTVFDSIFLIFDIHLTLPTYSEMGEEERHHRIVIQIRVPLPTFDVFHFCRKNTRMPPPASCKLACRASVRRWNGGMGYFI